MQGLHSSCPWRARRGHRGAASSAHDGSKDGPDTRPEAASHLTAGPGGLCLWCPGWVGMHGMEVGNCACTRPDCLVQVWRAWDVVAPVQPQLYLYSSADALIPPSEVQLFMQQQVRWLSITAFFVHT